MEIKYTDKEGETSIECGKVLVVVGANGSGKSHLGAAIEKFNPNNTFRIVSQRAINIPDSVLIRPKSTEMNIIQYGSENFKNKDNKYKGSYNNYTIAYVDDYTNVISTVLSVEMTEGQKAIEYIRKNGGERIPDDYPESILEKIYAVWKDLFPHRDLVVEGTAVKARLGDENYRGKYMSDGERSAFYLIAYSLIVPDGSFLIIDEPELHFHRALTTRLFDKIEENCKASCIVYLTHDLDFAASRKGASKLWIKSYDGTNFELRTIEPNAGIPEELYFEVLGCRQKVLFVEGENRDSFDFRIYSAIYDHWHVMPVGSCKNVQKLTEALNNGQARQLIGYDVKGLIDHDYRSETEISNLRDKNIEVLDVAEVENLFLLEDVVKVVASHLELNPEEKMEEVKEKVLKKLENQRETQILNRCRAELRYQFSKFSSTERSSIEQLKEVVNAYKEEINVEDIYDAASRKIGEIIASKDYVEALKIYNQKGLRKIIGQEVFKQNGDGYAELVIRLLSGRMKETMINAIKANLPSIDGE